jgi:adenosine deaminase
VTDIQDIPRPYFPRAFPLGSGVYFRMAHVSIEHPLDWGYHYQLIFVYTPGTRNFAGRIVGPVGTTGRVEHHLVTLIHLTVAGQPLRFTRRSDSNPSLSVKLPSSASAVFDIEIRLGGSESQEGELFGRYRVTARGVEYAEVFQKLTVFETRMLANERLHRWLPYPRRPLKPPLLRTDLHTHSSGQVSSEGLMELAVRNHIPYPTRLLDALGIPYSLEHVQRTKRYFYPPTDGPELGRIPAEEDAVPIDTLTSQGRKILSAAMSVPADRQVTFGDLEVSVYRFRTPITKSPAIAYDLLRKYAEEYAQQGVQYAEITATSNGLLVPEYLAMLHEKLPALEAETGVKLRFLAGLPRNLPEALLAREVEKLKIMGASPYLVGVDFVGFEDNKIGDLEPHIRSIAAWAQKHDPDFTLRIHAGENRKNLSNVRESLRLAQKYKMRVRIGHAAHGLDEEALEIADALAKEDLVMIEFNPDSNLALNNIDTAEELEMVKCLNREIPFVVCSDGGGLFQTDIWQLDDTASFAGLKEHHIDIIVKHEHAHMRREAARFARKTLYLPKDYKEQVEKQFAALPPLQLVTRSDDDAVAHAFEDHLNGLGIQFAPESIERATQGKRPILILGASGSRWWEKISREHKTAITELLQGLVARIDPKNAFLLIGRPKNTGITTVLSNAVLERNKGTATSEQVSLISATVQADQTTQSFTPGLTHVLPLRGGLFTVPHQLVDYVARHNGLVVFIGGGTFVRDAILVARERGVVFALMNGPEGASSDKSVMFDQTRQFNDLSGLLSIINSQIPNLLRRDH